jgi:hypothetical protein
MLVAAGLFGAEFRTSVRGQPMVRRANYQQEAEEIAPLDVPEMESVLADPAAPLGSMETLGGDCCDQPHCDGSYCGPGFCSPGGCWSYWGSVEFLLWWRKGQNLPPLVTTGPSSVDNAGVLGEPGTQILYATETQSGDARPGGRLTAGLWFDPCHLNGFGTRLFMLGESTAHFDRDSSTTPVLARPFFNVDTGLQEAVQIAFPDSSIGNISVRNTSRVGGGDVFFRRLFFTDGCRRIDLIAGYQFARIDTDLMISSNLEATPQNPPGGIDIGTTISVLDSFDTRNSYNAGLIGLWGTYDHGPITWSVLAKVGLGNMRQRTTITGQQVTTTPGPPPATDTVAQGLLALPTNIGIYKRTVFSVSPEIAFQGAYHLNNCIDVTFGYSFIYWTHVAQPGDQIDRSLDGQLLAGNGTDATRPAFPGNDSGYYVHGLNFGIGWQW